MKIRDDIIVDMDTIRILQAGDSPLLSDEEEQVLADRYNDYQSHLNDIEKESYAWKRENLHKLIGEMREEIGDEPIRIMRHRYNEGRLIELFETYTEMQKVIDKWVCNTEGDKYMLESYKEGQKAIYSKMEQTKKAIKALSVNNHGVNDEQIMRAREVKMMDVLGTKQIVTNCFNPQHRDKQASLNVQGNYYYCHGCGIKGNAIDYLVDYQDYKFKDAVLELNKY